MPLYRYIEVWSRDQGAAKLYRCFEVLGSERGFVVQSADHYTLQTYAERVPELELQFLELFLEQSPDERMPIKATLEEAIQYFDRSFE